MNTPYGFNLLVQTFSPSNIGLPNNSPFIPVRVIDIILSDKHVEFKNQGAWDSIGTIQFKPVYSPTLETSKNAFFFAKPFFSNIKHYPLKNEIVFVLFLSNQNSSNKLNGTYYYIDTINIWNSTHHNALPNQTNLNNLPEEQRRDYTQTATGASRRIADESSEISLGNTFKEKSNIHSLLPYEGDTIIEGRWGQSIRFGSTTNNSKIKNLWSSTGDNGNPITLIRNNQSPQAPKEGWVPILEDINNDGSSIYMVSNQTIPVVVSSNNIASFNTAFENKSSENIILLDVVPNISASSGEETDVNLDSNLDPTPEQQYTPPPSIIRIDEEIFLPGESDEDGPFGVINYTEFENEPVNDSTTNPDPTSESDPAGSSNVVSSDPAGSSNVVSNKDFIVYYNVSHQTQKDSVWCLIASISMYFDYLGVPMTQEDIFFTDTAAGRKFKNDGRTLKSPFTYTLNGVTSTQRFGYKTKKSWSPNYVAGSQNFEWTCVRNKGFTKKSKTYEEGTISSGEKGMEEIRKLIKSRRGPFVLYRKGTSGTDRNPLSHFIVVIGLDKNNNIIVNDPAFASSEGKNRILRKENLQPNNRGKYYLFSKTPIVPFDYKN